MTRSQMTRSKLNTFLDTIITYYANEETERILMHQTFCAHTTDTPGT